MKKHAKIFLLNWKKLVTLIATFFVFVFLHNIFYAIFGFEEGIFFILAVFVTPLYLFVAILYTAIACLKRRKEVKK